MNLTSHYSLIIRLSLSALWIFTALTTVLFARDISYAILAKNGMTGSIATLLIFAGSIVDLILGVWLLTTRFLKQCYLAQICVITSYTLLLTLIDSSYWLHPFGPLSKNIPLIAILYFLYRNESPN